MLVDMSETPVAFMIATFAVLIAFFVVDLFVIGRKPHVPSTKEARNQKMHSFTGSKPNISFLPLKSCRRIQNH